MPIRLKRAYVEAAEEDGYRILVERLWPRGISKETLQLDEWLKETAPTTQLRKWFGHDPDKWDEFCKRYVTELEDHSESLEPILERLRNGETLTFVFAARDEDRNSAVVLKRHVEGLLREQ